MQDLSQTISRDPSPARTGPAESPGGCNGGGASPEPLEHAPRPARDVIIEHNERICQRGVACVDAVERHGEEGTQGGGGGKGIC